MESFLPTCPLLGLHYYLPFPLPTCLHLKHRAEPAQPQQLLSNRHGIIHTSPRQMHEQQSRVFCYAGSSPPENRPGQVEEGQCNHEGKFVSLQLPKKQQLVISNYTKLYRKCYENRNPSAERRPLTFVLRCNQPYEICKEKWWTEDGCVEDRLKKPAVRYPTTQGTQGHVRFRRGALPCSPCLAQGKDK